MSSWPRAHLNMSGLQEKAEIAWSAVQSARVAFALFPAPNASMRSPLPPFPTVFIAMRSPLTITKTTALCRRFADGASLLIMCTMSAPHPTSPALRSVVSSLLGTLVPLTIAQFHSKTTLMSCAAQLGTMTTLMTWNCSLSSCVGATTLGGASCYTPGPHFSFLQTAPLLHHPHYLIIVLTTLCLPSS